MRPTFVTFSVLATLSGAVSAASHVRSSIHWPRQEIDFCGNIDAPLKIVDPATNKNKNFGTINTCLCFSQLSAFLDSSPVAEAAADVVGWSSVTDAVTALLDGAKDHETCSYPAHSSAVCDSDDPCGFTCTDGFTASPAKKPTACKCASPKVVCGGQCLDKRLCAPTPSSKPKGKGKRAEVVLEGVHGMAARLEALKQSCPVGWTPCGVYGGGRNAWECIDTRSDLESCGGCAVPLPFVVPSSHLIIGEDCTSLPGVDDVGCVHGRCAVRRCSAGYAVASSGDGCVQTRTNATSSL